MNEIEIASDPHRQQHLYWNEMINLKADASYIRLYGTPLAGGSTGLGALKAIASCGGIAAWVIWKEYAFVWGAIIAIISGCGRSEGCFSLCEESIRPQADTR
jgi:hypothetical protein